MNTIPLQHRNCHRGSASVLAISALAVVLIFVLIVADMAVNARRASNRQWVQAATTSLVEAGINYGYWQVAWKGASLPYSVTNRVLGPGSFSVTVSDNSSSIPNSYKIACSATVNGRTQSSTVTRISITKWRPVLWSVSAANNLWMSGMQDGTTYVYGGETDITPAQSPSYVPDLTLVAGSKLKFTATGSSNNVPSAPPAGQGPDGGSGTFTAALGARNGIASITAPTNSLIGVFLGASQPNLTAAPAALSFSTTASRNYLTLSPLLKQPFFIGDGKTSNGTQQQIVVPAGATRIYLCNMDAYGYWNNYGSINVTIQPAP